MFGFSPRIASLTPRQRQISAVVSMAVPDFPLSIADLISVKQYQPEDVVLVAQDIVAVPDTEKFTLPTLSGMTLIFKES